MGSSSGAHPHGLLVDKEGRVWYTGNGNGTIGELDPATGKVREHRAPSGGSPHTVVDRRFGRDLVLPVSPVTSGASTELAARSRKYRMSGGPYGPCARQARQRLGVPHERGQDGDHRFEDGEDLGAVHGPGSQPRRVATAPDGSLWITLYGKRQARARRSAAVKIIKEYEMPAGASGGRTR